MNTHADKSTKTKSNAVANGMAEQQSGEHKTFQLEDNRPEAIAQRKLQEAANNSEQVKQLKALQEMANNSQQVKQLRAVQTMADNNAIQLKEIIEGKALPALVQKKLHVIGSKGAINVPAFALTTARRIVNSGAEIRVGGAKHIENVQNRGLMGYKGGRGKEFVGGEVYNNNAMADGQKLPLANYTEWDIRPAVAAQNRGTERVVMSEGGSFYFTNDHYANFTEFKI